jgi:hypothetical protein
MTDVKQADSGSVPSSLKVAAAAMAGAQLLAFALSTITALAAASVLVTCLVAFFVGSTRSRITWLLALMWASGQIVGSVLLNERLWLILPAGVVFVCLTRSSSRQFIWSSARPGVLIVQPGAQQRGRALYVCYGTFTTYVHRASSLCHTMVRDTRNLGRLIGLIVVSLIVLYPLVGVVYNFQHGSGRGSVLVDILWHVVWLCYAVAQVALVIVVILAVYRYTSDRRRRVNASRL